MLESSMGMGGMNVDESLSMDLDSFADFANLGDQSLILTPGTAAALGAGSGVSTTDHSSQDANLMVAATNGMFAGPSPSAQTQNSGQQSQADVPMTGAGAGPLPTGFGLAQQNGNSTLTEFTKRRNWSQRIIEELKDFLHILTPDGRILYVSPSCKGITGYEAHTLIGKFIGEYVHPDDSGIFMREFNESIASGNSLRFFYRFKKDDGTYMIFECDGHPHISPEPPGAHMGLPGNSDPNNTPVPVAGVCRGFFMMARPYPTRNAAFLDSFLEHKIENERLLKRIEELKREELEENVEQDRLYAQAVNPSQAGVTPSDVTNSKAQDTQSEAPSQTPNYQGMPPPSKPSITNTALTRQNLDSALSAQKPDSIADKMSRYEASNTHLESIELLTGLRYRDGERSHGISTGDTSPALIRGDAGIAILLDRDRDGNSKKDRKKQKVADEYVCADCGTLDSPEWRKGPRGPKTLCNACGLRWAKKEKKRTGDDKKDDSPPSSAMHGLQGLQQQQSPGRMPGLQHSHSGSIPMAQPHMTGMGGMVPGLPMGQSTGSSG